MKCSVCGGVVWWAGPLLTPTHKVCHQCGGINTAVEDQEEEDMASNYPPGVTDSDIPGNTPEDAAWEGLHELIDSDAREHQLDPVGARQVWVAGLAAYRAIANESPECPGVVEEQGPTYEEARGWEGQYVVYDMGGRTHVGKASNIAPSVFYIVGVRGAIAFGNLRRRATDEEIRDL